MGKLNWEDINRNEEVDFENVCDKCERFWNNSCHKTENEIVQVIDEGKCDEFVERKGKK